VTQACSYYTDPRWHATTSSWSYYAYCGQWAFNAWSCGPPDQPITCLTCLANKVRKRSNTCSTAIFLKLLSTLSRPRASAMLSSPATTTTATPVFSYSTKRWRTTSRVDPSEAQPDHHRQAPGVSHRGRSATAAQEDGAWPAREKLRGWVGLRGGTGNRAKSVRQIRWDHTAPARIPNAQTHGR
jgi:hypothetical protein